MGRLSAALRRRWMKVWRPVDHWLASRGARGWGGMAYYALFNPSFRRECRSVLAGRLAYEQRLKDPGASSTRLRRNIHRLEKGLLMRPRRSVFALDYIQETVEAYVLCVNEAAAGRVNSEEVQWAGDVLKAYFSAVETQPLIDAQRKNFEACCPSLNEPPSCIPYKRNEAHRPDVSLDDLEALARFRRSVRWFLDRPVPRELVEKAVAVAAQAPSACNRQPFRFHVFDDPELLRKVAALPAGTDGFYDQFPMVIVLVGDLGCYFSERDRHVMYIDSGLAAMGLVYALEAQGLSSCCINWPDIEEREQSAEILLKLKPEERPVMFMAVGYPDPEGMVAFSKKKPTETLVRYNFE